MPLNDYDDSSLPLPPSFRLSLSSFLPIPGKHPAGSLGCRAAYVMSCHASASSVTHFADSPRPPTKDHRRFGNCFSAVLQFPKIPFVFVPSRNWRRPLARRTWAIEIRDLGIGKMTDVPSATFVIRSFARHSVSQAGMAYNERAEHALVVGGSFPIHESRCRVASRPPLKCVFGGTRQFSWLVAAAALAFIAVWCAHP